MTRLDIIAYVLLDAHERCPLPEKTSTSRARPAYTDAVCAQRHLLAAESG
ncbi:MAG: hypothetical protein KF764_10490 [Labilithrix sp.]|nr:hypothetical protein [Labilithrix sp.]